FASRGERRAGPVDLNHVIEDLRLILARSAGSDVRLITKGDPDLPEIPCDAAQLEQLLLNLTVNAREAMPNGGSLTISTSLEHTPTRLFADGVTLPPSDYAVISVSDTGKGMPEEVRSRIFEPFFSTKSRPGSASGLGLSTVHRIVRGHGGGIVV